MDQRSLEHADEEDNFVQPNIKMNLQINKFSEDSANHDKNQILQRVSLASQAFGQSAQVQQYDHNQVNQDGNVVKMKENDIVNIQMHDQ